MVHKFQTVSISAKEVKIGDNVGYSSNGIFKSFGLVSDIEKIDDCIYLKLDAKHYRRLHENDTILID